METDGRVAIEPSMTSLVGGIIDDAQTLVRQEITLTKRELTEELRKAKAAAISMAIGAGVVAIGGLLVLLMVVHLLAWAYPELPLWVCYAIVAGVVTIVGGAWVYLGKREFADVHFNPLQNFKSQKEEPPWTSNPR